MGHKGVHLGYARALTSRILVPAADIEGATPGARGRGPGPSASVPSRVQDAGLSTVLSPMGKPSLETNRGPPTATTNRERKGVVNTAVCFQNGLCPDPEP